MFGVALINAAIATGESNVGFWGWIIAAIMYLVLSTRDEMASDRN